jgi:hypothetical protein
MAIEHPNIEHPNTVRRIGHILLHYAQGMFREQTWPCAMLLPRYRDYRQLHSQAKPIVSRTESSEHVANLMFSLEPILSCRDSNFVAIPAFRIKAPFVQNL